MNERLQDYGVRLIELLEEGKAFVGEQAPIFIEEVLTYYTYYHSTYVAVTLIVLVGAAFIIRRGNQELAAIKNDPNRSAENGDGADWAMSMAISCIAGIISAVLLIVHVLSLVKITVAPRLYLIERLSTIMH